MKPSLNDSYRGLRAVIKVYPSVDVVAVMQEEVVLLPMIT